MLNQATLIDITGDGKDDVIIPMYNKIFLALDGETLENIWNFTVADSAESYIPAAPAYFNSDNVSDFFIMYSHIEEGKPHSTVFNFVIFDSI